MRRAALVVLGIAWWLPYTLAELQAVDTNSNRATVIATWIERRQVTPEELDHLAKELKCPGWIGAYPGQPAAEAGREMAYCINRLPKEKKR